MSDARTQGQESGQPRRRRGLLEEIRRVRENVGHRRACQSDRRRTLQDLSGGADAPEAECARANGRNPASVRREWQARRRLVRLMRLAVAGCAIALALVFAEGRGTAEAACRETENFLWDASRSLWGTARERYFSTCLKEAESPERFSRDIQLLESKLGRLNRYALTSASVSPFRAQCEVSYELVFERGEAKGFFEMMRENDRWVVDTFCFWAPAWKKL